MSHDQFVKNYSYSFRHMFGKEGGRKNYTPYSCMKIIMGNPPEPGAHHGCPYRHMPDNQLASLLMSLKLNNTDIKSIIETAKKESNYQLACQKHFDITHPGHYEMDLKLVRLFFYFSIFPLIVSYLLFVQSDHIVANHPNQWYQASVNYHKLKSGEAIGTAMTPASQGQLTGGTDISKDISLTNETSASKMTVEPSPSGNSAAMEVSAP